MCSIEFIADDFPDHFRVFVRRTNPLTIILYDVVSQHWRVEVEWIELTHQKPPIIYHSIHSIAMLAKRVCRFEPLFLVVDPCYFVDDR